MKNGLIYKTVKKIAIEYLFLMFQNSSLVKKLPLIKILATYSIGELYT